MRALLAASSTPLTRNRHDRVQIAGEGNAGQRRPEPLRHLFLLRHTARSMSSAHCAAKATEHQTCAYQDGEGWRQHLILVLGVSTSEDFLRVES